MTERTSEENTASSSKTQATEDFVRKVGGEPGNRMDPFINARLLNMAP